MERSSLGYAPKAICTWFGSEDVNLTPDPDDIEYSVRIGGPLSDPTLWQSTLATFSDFYWAQSTDAAATAILDLDEPGIVGARLIV